MIRPREHTHGVDLRTFVDVLRERARRTPAKIVFDAEADDGAPIGSLSFAALDRRARAIAARLADEGLRGERAVLLYPHGLEFLAAFFGCLYAGVTAVPCSLPRRDRGMGRLRGIVADCAPRALLTAASLAEDSGRWAADVPGWGGVTRVATDAIDEDRAILWRGLEAGPDDLALLQYTSGSTAAPKGVMISHANLLANSARIRACFGSDATSRGVFWLPLFHDMGLIGGVLQTVDCGGRSTLMSPVAFLQRPLRWLEAISRTGATISGGPDFAYDQCVRKIPEEAKANLDLSRWSVAFNGAEPIRPETLDRFAEAFAPCGFRREAFLPCYGLAESTLLVSGRRAGTGPSRFAARASALAEGRVERAEGDDRRTLIGSGPVAEGHEVAVVDPEARSAMPEGRVGELWVRGPSVAEGYWNRPDDSRKTFAATRSDGIRGHYLRTGDLGFVRHGEVFVAGRSKDLIIVRGRNVYPQDVEWTVEGSHPALRAGGGAAFSVEQGGEERLVVVHEVERSARGPGHHPAIFGAILQAVAEAHDLDLLAIHLIRPMGLPRTSSGKVRRHACRERLRDGSLDAIASWTATILATGGDASPPDSHKSPADLESWIAERVAGASGLLPGDVERDRPITRYGLDSLRAIELKAGLESDWGADVPLGAILDGPTIAALAEITAAVLADPVAAPDPGPNASDDPGVSDLPTPGQQALWYAHHLSPRPGAYNIAGAARVTTEVDLDAFRAALDRLVARHDGLRTTFPSAEGRPAMVVAESAPCSFAHVDARDWTAEAVAGACDAEAARPFDLGRGPLHRVVLWSRSPIDHVALLVVHHIVGDFWTTAVILDEFARLYAEERGGASASLAPLPLRFGDYSRWQSRMLSGPAGERLAAFWATRLEGTLPVLELPTDRPRSAARSQGGGVRHRAVDAALTRGLSRLADACGATPYATLLAAFQVFLARLAGQDEVVVGSPVSGRTRPGLGGIVGYFVNLLPMRASLARDPSFVDFLAGVRDSVNQGLAHQDYPFGKMVEAVAPAPDPGRTPIFQAMFIYQKAQRLADRGLTPFALAAPGHRLELGGLGLESLGLDKKTSLFDLTLMAAPAGDRLALALEYDADLFDPSTADRMLGRFSTLLGAIVAGPEARVSSLPLMDAEERRRVVSSWAVGDAPADPRAGLPIPRLVEGHARRAPASAAVRDGSLSVNYEELNERSNQIARRLRSLGVGPGRFVGLCVGRSPRLLSGVLGTLKAGGAYVPLDPSHPLTRRAEILRDATAAALIIDASTRDLAGSFAGHVVDLDADAEALGLLPKGNLDEAPDLDDPAYVVYTSGSTGAPKGVVVAHRGLTAIYLAWESAYALSPSPGPHLQMAGVAFDVFAGDWVRALGSGATLVLCPRDTLLDPRSLADLMGRERIAVAEFVPAVTDALADHLERSGRSLPDLRLVAVGSDAWRVAQYERLRKVFGPSARVVNSYGLTEATIDSTFIDGPLGHLPPDRPVPIGRPFAGSRVYVLDRRFEPCPVGVPGELFIGGPGVAIGYLDRPALTADRFVPDPFGGRPGSRLYRTGDLARWRDDGTLQLLGRGDGQVKIRGHRIELGEVEAALLRHPGVSKAAVVVSGDGRLAAWFVGRGGATAEPAELRRWLRERLPEYMVPATIAALDSLPLTANGKVDRSALAARSRPEAGAIEARVAPRDEVEAALERIVSEVLKVESVGVEDDLFAIGTDSIAIIQIVARARDRGLPLDPSRVFRLPTIAGLAGSVRDSSPPAAWAPSADPFAEIRREAMADDPHVEDAYPLTPVQEGMLFHSTLEPESGAYVEQFRCVLDGDLDEEAFLRAWSGLVARHSSLRSAVRWNDDRPIQVVLRQPDLPVDRFDWRGLDEDEQDARFRDLIAADRSRGFVLTFAPLTRLALVRVGERRRRLVWTSHHLVLDGWCLPLLLSDVLALYEAEVEGRPAALPPAPRFRDYVEWLGRPDLAAAEAFWRSNLDGFREPTPTGLATPRTGAEGRGYAEVESPIDPAVSSTIGALARTLRVTLGTIVQGAWGLLLSRDSGRTHVVFGVTVSGRPPDLPGVESMVGALINTLPLRLHVDEDADLATWLALVQGRQMAMRRFEASPPLSVHSWSQIPRGRPLFESLVVLQNTPSEADLLARAGRLGIREPRVDDRTSYPLTLTVVPGESIALRLGYDARRFDDEAVARMLGDFRAILEAMAGTPNGRLADLLPPRRSEPAPLLDRLSDLDVENLDHLTDHEIDALLLDAQRPMPGETTR